MALKLLIFFPLLIASCALAELKIYCTPEDDVTPKEKDGDKKDDPNPKVDGGGGATTGGNDSNECPDPKGGGGGGGGGGGVGGGGADPKGGGDSSPDPKGGDGGVDGKDCPNPTDGDGGGAAPRGGSDGKDCPIPKGEDSRGDGKDCPDPKGANGGDVAPIGGDGGKDCPNPKDTDSGNASPNGGGGGKECPNPKGAGDYDTTPKGDGDGKDSPDPKGAGGNSGKDYVDPKGAGGGDGKDCPDPKDASGGGGKDHPDPKGAGGGNRKDCPDPKGRDDGGATPKGRDKGKDCPDPKGVDGGSDKKDKGDGKNSPNPKGGGGRKDCPNPKGGGDSKKKASGDKNKNGAAPFYKQPIFESDYKGEWIVHNPNVGVCAMQYQLMPNNKAVWFDTTNLGPSTLELGPKGNCPPNPDNNNEPDCFAHGIQYDVETGDVKTVYVETDPWCSSGHMLPSGDLLSTGGNKMGQKAVRLLKKDDLAPVFLDKKNALGASHWYASNVILEDGSAAIIGGRESYTYDLVPATATVEFKPNSKDLPFLKKTTTPKLGPKLHVENNLYPFVYLLPDGNIFIFANDRAISFNPQTGKTVKEYPVLQGGSRNYPPSGQSAILPLRLTTDNKPVTVEVVVCGGNKPDAYQNVDPRYTQNRVFAPAFSDCNRIVATADKPIWQKEQRMPSPRVMGDLLQLPNGQFLLINGAKKGTSGWDDGEDPNFTPTVYMPENLMGNRFKELKPTNIPRMYHSVSSVLPDGKILVAGSNCHQYYTFNGPYPTELRVEKFSPHYLDPKFEKYKPVITADTTDKMLKYGKEFKVTFKVPSSPNLTDGDVIVTLLKPPFTTHGFSQNQRMLVCGIVKLDKNIITAIAPASGKLAPPGYYIMYVNHRNIPSKGVWVQVGH